MTHYRSNSEADFSQLVTQCCRSYPGFYPYLSSTFPHRPSSIAEWILLDCTVISLCNCPGIHQHDKGNENSSFEALWMSMNKQIKEVNKPDPHSLVINRKIEGEESDYLPRTGWNTNWIFLLAFENVDIFIYSSCLHVLFSQLAEHPK